MANSTLINDYVGRGAHASRPSSPPIGSGASAVYYETDTGDSFIWTGSTWVQINVGGGGGGGLYGSAIVAPPALASFAWVNQGTSTAIQSSDNIMITPQTTNPAQWRLLVQAQPSTPYSVLVYLRADFISVSSQTAGLYFYDSGSGKIAGLEALNQIATAKWRVEHLSNPTTGVGTVYSGPQMFGQSSLIGQGAWLKLSNNGSTLTYGVSMDGYNWITLYSEVLGAFITPDSIGFGALSEDTTTSLHCSLLSWQATSP